MTADLFSIFDEPLVLLLLSSLEILNTKYYSEDVTAMRVALYCRVSTSDQKVDAQLDGLREYARARGFEVVHEYLDEGISGAKARRPGLDQMLEAAHRRRFDGIVVWRLDRIARSVKNGPEPSLYVDGRPESKPAEPSGGGGRSKRSRGKKSRGRRSR